VSDNRIELLKYKLKKELNIGSIAGFIGFAFFLILYFIGLQPLGMFSLVGVSIPIVMLFFGNQFIKKHIFGGNMSFGLVFQSSLTMCLVYASMFAMLVYLFSISISADMTQVIYERSVEEFEIVGNLAAKTNQNGIDQDALTEHLKLLKETSLGDLVWQEFSSKLFGGLILSLFAGLIFKSKR
jgi:hypothetical protein